MVNFFRKDICKYGWKPFFVGIFQIFVVYIILFVGNCFAELFYLFSGEHKDYVNVWSVICSLFFTFESLILLFSLTIILNLAVYLFFTTLFRFFVNYNLDEQKGIFTFKDIFSKNINLAFLFVVSTSLFTFLIANYTYEQKNPIYSEGKLFVYFFLSMNFSYVLGYLSYIYIDFFKDIKICNKYDEKVKIVLGRAEKIKDRHGDSGLHDFIRALIFPSMYKHIYSCITAPDHRSPCFPECFDFFPIGNLINSGRMIKVDENNKDRHLIHLSRDIVFTTPWNPTGIVAHPGGIGHRVDFYEDPLNHDICIIYPMKICIVMNGNHSIMQGILNGTGTIHAKYYICLSKQDLNRYTYDGTNWIENSTNKKTLVKNHDVGLVWEISKLLDEIM